MRVSLLIAVAAVMVMQACSSTSSQEAAALSGACQIRKCACGPRGWTAFSAGGNVPVQWRRTGEAFCPDGYSLHLIEQVPGETAKLAP